MTLKFTAEDAEAVIAKALEGGSDSEEGEPLFAAGSPVEAMKRDGKEMETKNQAEKKLQVRNRKFFLQMRKHLRRCKNFLPHHCQQDNLIQVLLYYLN